MTQPAASYKLNSKLEPLCPRDNKIMRYEAVGVPAGTDSRPSYHCDHEGCSVRYDVVDGYCTLMGAPNLMYPVEEPGVNTLRCEKHGTWLYLRRVQAGESGAAWSCGVDGCDYGTQTASKGSWLSRLLKNIEKEQIRAP
ncbi:MAG: hypothetical protein ACRD51_10760 [Candidatus Acidiferrum sp.]